MERKAWGENYNEAVNEGEFEEKREWSNSQGFWRGVAKKNENPQSNYDNWYTQQIRVD